MIKIRKTDIQLTRGDTAYITLSITDGSGKPLIIGDNDVIRCQVWEAACGGRLLFEGVIERDDGIIWHISPEDTAGEEPGNYYWDGQVEYQSGDIFTFVPVSLFRILPEVTEVVENAGN